MRIDADRPQSSAGRYFHMAGIGVVVITAGAQALTVGRYWWSDPGNPFFIKSGTLALIGWCVAAIALLLGRYFTPYSSIVVPAGVAAGSIWMSVEFLRQEGVAYWPLGQINFENMTAMAAALAAFSMFLVGPVSGAWLAGYGSRRRRRQLQLHRISADVFD
jgi:hypothetical protein